MKKRFLILLASLMLIILVIASCGKDKNNGDDNSAEVSTTGGDTSAPDTSTPDTSKPDTSKPDTSTPDTSAPDTSIPDDTSKPDDSTDPVTPHDHDWQITKTEGSNCKDAGGVTVTFTCSICKNTKTEVSKDHVAGEYTVTTPATCLTDGVKMARCIYCNKVAGSEKIDSFGGHNMQPVETVEMDCTPGHQTDGYTLYRCANQGCVDYTDDRRDIVYMAHAWDTKATIIEPTCVDAGERSYLCTVCGTKDPSRITEIQAEGHDMQSINVTPATCEVPEYTHYECSKCSFAEDKSTSPALGHTETFIEEITKEATCQETGTKIFKCERCQQTMKTETLEKAEHVFIENEDVILPADCTHNERYVYSCKWADQNCTATKEVDVPDGDVATGHIAGDILVTTVGFACNGGYRVYICKTCDEDVNVPLDPVPHTPDGISQVETPVTCIKDGYTTYTCSVCTETYKDDIIEATGKHVFDKDAQTTLPTCTSEGYTVYHCSSDDDCIETETREYVARTSHSFTRMSYMHLFCSECGITYENFRGYIEDDIEIKDGNILTDSEHPDVQLEVTVTGSKEHEKLVFDENVVVWEADEGKVITEGVIYVTTNGTLTLKFEYKDADGNWHEIDAKYIHVVDGAVYADVYYSDVAFELDEEYVFEGFSGIRVTVEDGDAADASVEIFA